MFGPVLVNVYGSTETGIVSMATPEDLADEPSTLGRPGIGISVRILRDDRSVADTGERGTIFMRGGLLFDGYTEDGDSTPDAKEVVDKHVNTGDMGHLDDQGRLYVDGRDDDMVVSGGENVFPLEVEQALGEHPSVDEAVVMGIEHEEFGQVLRAYVTVTSGEPPKDTELRDFLRERLERFKVPKEFVVLDEFPRNATGKIVKSKLDDRRRADLGRSAELVEVPAGRRQHDGDHGREQQSADERVLPGGGVAGTDRDDLGDERAVDRASQQGVRQHPGVGVLEAQRPQAVVGDRQADEDRQEARMTRCPVPSHDGAAMPSLPYIHSAPTSCPTASTPAATASHTFIWIMLAKPSVVIGSNVGWC